MEHLVEKWLISLGNSCSSIWQILQGFDLPNNSETLPFGGLGIVLGNMLDNSFQIVARNL